MASTFEASAYLADYPMFQSRVGMAMVRAAIDVGAEEYDGSERARLRRALAINVLQEPELWAERFSYSVASNPIIDVTTSDTDLSWTVSSIWDAMAGAPPEAAA